MMRQQPHRPATIRQQHAKQNYFNKERRAFSSGPKRSSTVDRFQKDHARLWRQRVREIFAVRDSPFGFDSKRDSDHSSKNERSGRATGSETAIRFACGIRRRSLDGGKAED